MADAPADNPADISAEAPAVSILVVSYNTREMTLDCLRSVVGRTEGVDHELIVVDNASTDGSAEAIAAEFPSARLILPGRNLGFGPANNLGAKAARGEYLLLLNPDTLVLGNAVATLLAFARAQPQAGIWGGRTRFGDGSLNPSSCWRFMSPWSILCGAIGLSRLRPQSDILNPEAYGRWRRDSIREVDIVTGCLLLIRRDFWQRLGGFDPDFFMYAEEADLCWRARAAGARPMITPEAEIVHFGGASEPARAPKMVRLLSGKMTFIARHWSPGRRRLAGLLFRIHVLFRLAGFTLLAPVMARARAGRTTWSEVWAARHRWLKGYPPAG